MFIFFLNSASGSVIGGSPFPGGNTSPGGGGGGGGGGGVNFDSSHRWKVNKAVLSKVLITFHPLLMVRATSTARLRYS